MSSPVRIVFFGTPGFAVASLRALTDSGETLAGVVCQPDKPVGRGHQLAAPPVKRLASELGLPLLQPEKVRTPEFLESLRQWAPDVIIVAAYGRILPASILQLPSYGCINVHASLLPRWRGAAPIQWAILAGDAETGITIMQMNEEMDAGDILLQRRTPIDPEDTYATLEQRLARLGGEALGAALLELRSGTLAPMIRKENGRIRWSDDAARLQRMVRAFDPWPSAFTELDGKRLKILRAHVDGSPTTAAAGTVTSVAGGLAIATASGTLIIDEVQLEGRRRMSAAELVRGQRLEVGTVLT
jgi:methionyl-tRNA formyltransferase